MAATVGTDGIICVDGTTTNPAYVDSWTINASIDTAEISAYGSTNKEYVSTLKGHTLSMSATLDLADAKQSALITKFSSGSSTSVEVRCYLNSALPATYWRSYAIPTGLTVNSQIGDKVSVTVNFQGSSALSYQSS